MSDEGFVNQDFCSIKGAYINRPSHKKIPVFRAEGVADCDIAATSIYFERLTRRVREWSILINV